MCTHPNFISNLMNQENKICKHDIIYELSPPRKRDLYNNSTKITTMNLHASQSLVTEQQTKNVNLNWKCLISSKNLKSK